MKIIDGWTMLRHKRDYKSWHKKEAAAYGCEPATYPCFVQSSIDASEDPYYEYLYPASVKCMTLALESTESRMAAQAAAEKGAGVI